MPTAGEIAAALRFTGEFERLRKRAGNPSYDEFERLVPHIPRSTLHNALSGTRKSLADWPLFRPLLLRCIELARNSGVMDSGTEAEWLEFWKAATDGRIIPSPLESAAVREKFRREQERARALGGSGVFKTLEALYPGYPLVDLWGVKHPIAEFPAPPGQWDDTEAAAGEILDRRVPAEDAYADDFDPGIGRAAFFRYVDRYRSASAEDRRRFFPGVTYALRRMTRDPLGAVTLDCSMGRYFTSLATSEDLDSELMESLVADPERAVPLGELPRRSWLHEQVGDPLLDGRHRDAAISHATVVLTATGDGGYDILLPERSRDVATHANFNHVAPSGIFAPYDETSPSPLEEYSVRRNFFREWTEELFAAEEHEHPQYSVVIPDPEDEPEITRLKDLLRSGRGRLKYTGVSYNLLTLRPEICMALIVGDRAWFREEDRIAREMGRRFEWGWEYERKVWEGTRAHGKPGQLRLRLDSDLQPTGGTQLTPSFLIPNAAAAISLAVRMLRLQLQGDLAPDGLGVGVSPGGPPVGGE
ncbi:hypothetical protein AB0D49_36590 [Streptomyces sp. NPDC048290]|uniref:hypothetical protein n=1 Tax=Streptomyces sp. NPDC048290 TaxID=3155811 RepID=UPI00341A7621